MSLKRTLIGMPLAVIVTVGLGLTMANLIKTNFTPPIDQPEQLSFEINEQIDPFIIEPIIDRPELRAIEILPAATIIDKGKSDLPAAIDFTLVTTIPPIEKPSIDMGEFQNVTIDQDEGPILRVPPKLPKRAERSGHCVMHFDVSAEGAPYNVRVAACSQTLFESASVKAVQKWKYRPKVSGGITVARTGLETTIRFELLDERGNIIPE